MTEGWIKISRGLNDHWIWKDPIKFQWWIDMLITVNYKDGKVNIGNQLIECKRGQSLLSLQSWGLRWKVDKNKVRNFFVLLEKDGMITHENLSKTTRITICKYESYQGFENAIKTQSKRNQNAIKTQPNPIEESKEEKESKEGNKILLEKETKDISPKKELNYENLKKFWNEIVEGTSIAKINEISEKRKNTLKSLFAVYSREEFIEVLSEALKSDFLNGNNKNNFSMSFDWFVKKDNFLKVMEGNYKNKAITPTKIIPMPKQVQKTIELSEEEKTQMRRQSGLID